MAAMISENALIASLRLPLLRQRIFSTGPTMQMREESNEAA